METRPIKAHNVRINIPEVNLLPDGPFCMSFDFDLEILKKSISKYGIINPPYLIKNLDNSYSVVTGYKRLLAAHELGWKGAECNVLPDSFTEHDALLFNLDDNLLHREFNSIEKAMILDRLVNFLKKEEIIEKYLPLLTIPANRHSLLLYLNLNMLEEIVKVSVARNAVSLKVAGLMANIDRESRLGISSLFNSLKFSINQQVQLFQYLEEISRREGKVITDIINSSDVQEIVADTNMNKPQKVKAITAVLKNRRFPLLSEAHKAFKNGLDRLSLPSGVNVISPPFFEGVNYRLEIDFSRGEELTDKINKLHKLAELSEVPNFWKGRGDT